MWVRNAMVHLMMGGISFVAIVRIRFVLDVRR